MEMLELTQKLNLLIIEDENCVTRTLQRTLKKYWKNIDFADNSALGLSKLDTEEYDVVLTDWDCPEENSGLLIIQNSSVPTVVFTGNSSVSNMDLGVQVLNKTAKPEEINTALVLAWLNNPIN